MPKKDILSSKRAQKCALPPIQSVVFVTQSGPRGVSSGEISPEIIGWKAYGLCCMPSGWVPPFFVISGSCLDGSVSDEILRVWVNECAETTGVTIKTKSIMIRSSGTSETIRNRGQLISSCCSLDGVLEIIKKSISLLPASLSGTVHWIVQECIDSKEKGHLSNERHLRREKRDWVAEFEPKERRPGYVDRFGVRNWRDGKDSHDTDLRCNSDFEISLVLKRVALWASRFSSRIHFEWVWDSNQIHMVQADEAEPATGFDPRLLIKDRIIESAEPAIDSLKLFRPATPEDLERYGKLRNAKLYGELSYKMPTFYVLNDAQAVTSILAGQIPLELEQDLIELTKRPLIIRTDGASIPENSREMLPRSEDLRTDC